jgi:hypothetical protein
VVFIDPIMALDALEKDQLRRKMATRMGSFLEGGKSVSCVSGHFYDELHDCELCQTQHANDILVIKNRSGKKMRVASSCLREMVRFQVSEVEDLPKWLTKLGELKGELEKRKEQQLLAREEERRRLEKKVIVRKRSESETA